jgi:Mn-containing catalase
VAVQELMSGRFGEMSTLMNYTFQSFGFRGRKELRSFYDLIANIAAEEDGHIEAVAQRRDAAPTRLPHQRAGASRPPRPDLSPSTHSRRHCSAAPQ